MGKTWYQDIVNGNTTYDGKGWRKKEFTSGGVAKIEAGDVVVGASSGAQITVDWVDTCVLEWGLNDNAASNVVLASIGENGQFIDGYGVPINTNVESEAGKIGNCLHLPSDVHVESGVVDYLPNGSTPRSVEMWFKYTNALTDTISLFWQQGDDGSDFWQIAMKTDHKLYTVSTYTAEVCLYNTALTAGTWYHLVFVFDGTKVLCYVNNSLKLQPAMSIDTAYTNKQFWIGRLTGTDANGHRCDAFRIWPFALTATQVSLLYNGSVGADNIWTAGVALGNLYCLDNKVGTFVAENLNVAGKQNNIATIAAGDIGYSSKQYLDEFSVIAYYGDTIISAKSNGFGSTGIDATWTFNSANILLASALTKNICMCETAWTPSANVSRSSDGVNYREGTYSESISIGASFVSGKVAYWDLGAPEDFSSYQQVSFVINASIAEAAGKFQLLLCSDATGDVPVNTLAVPAITQGGVFIAFTVDNGSALGSNIRSIALNAVSDPGTVVVKLDDIIACKAPTAGDSLSLTSLISKNALEQGGTEAWYPVRSINGVDIVLGTGATTPISTKYGGATETVPLYKRETSKTVIAGTTTTRQTLANKGSTLGDLYVKGGYNPATNVQDGETIFDGQVYGYGYGLAADGKDNVQLERMSFVRYNYAVRVTSTGDRNNLSFHTLAASFYGLYHAATAKRSNVSVVGNVGCSAGVYVGISMGCNFDVGFSCGHTGATDLYSGWYEASTQFVNNNVRIDHASCNGANGIYQQGNDNNYRLGDAKYNGASYGMKIAGFDNKFRKLSTEGNALAGIYIAHKGDVNLYDCTLAEATPVVWATASPNYLNQKVFSHNDGGVAGTHKTYMEYGVVQSVADVDGGLKWKIQPSEYTYRGYWSGYPMKMKIASVICEADKTYTVDVFMDKNRATDKMYGKLVCRPWQLEGIDTQIEDEEGAAGVIGGDIPSTNKANPTVFSYTNHGLEDGDKVYFSGITQEGWTALNGQKWTVTYISSSQFSIAVDSTGYPANYLNTDPGVWTFLEKLSVSFTPTEDGIVDITLEIVKNTSATTYMEATEVLISAA